MEGPKKERVEKIRKEVTVLLAELKGLTAASREKAKRTIGRGKL